MRCAPINDDTNTPTASPPARSRVLGRHRPIEQSLHGCQTNAAAAPSNKPPDRVRVDKYTKLVRSLPSNKPNRPSIGIGAERCTHHIKIHDTNTPVIRTRNRMTCETDQPMRATQTNGHTTYHCSSTARLHRCRSIEGSPGAKYGTSPAIWPQLAAYSTDHGRSRRICDACSADPNSATQVATATSTAPNAGNKRRARRTQNDRKLTESANPCSSMSNIVMRNPDTTKNTSTPRKPPDIHEKPA